MLCYEGPLRVIHAVIEVCYSDLGSPVILVVQLDMPVHPYRAHVACALEQWRTIFSRCVHTCRGQNLRVFPGEWLVTVGKHICWQVSQVIRYLPNCKIVVKICKAKCLKRVTNTGHLKLTSNIQTLKIKKGFSELKRLWVLQSSGKYTN